jgi:LacI family transcriptional regulator
MGIEHAWHDFDNHAFALNAVRGLASAGRKRLALLSPPPHLTYNRHMSDGFAAGLAECGCSEVPFRDAWIDTPIEELKARALSLLQRGDAPDGIVCGSGAAAFALVSALEDAGLKLGEDIDIATKQSSKLVKMFRRELMTVDEDFRFAGIQLARAIKGRIDGVPADTLQTLAAPKPAA